MPVCGKGKNEIRRRLAEAETAIKNDDSAKRMGLSIWGNNICS